MSSSENKTVHSDSVQTHKAFLFPAVAMYYQEPIALDRGERMDVCDETGNKYRECSGGALTTSLGHVHPHVREAIIDQVQKLNQASMLYANGPQSGLAAKLAEIAPGRLEKSFFTNSGTEADETATMAAKVYTGR